MNETSSIVVGGGQRWWSVLRLSLAVKICTKLAPSDWKSKITTGNTFFLFVTDSFSFLFTFFSEYLLWGFCYRVKVWRSCLSSSVMWTTGFLEIGWWRSSAIYRQFWFFVIRIHNKASDPVSLSESQCVLVYLSADKCDTAVSFIFYIMHCADGEPQIFFFHVYHELLIKFSAVLLLAHHKWIILTHGYTRPQCTVHSELKSAVKYIIFQIKSCGESL